jgi:hypothetical protein
VWLYARRTALHLSWFIRLALALFLFVGALQVMKTGAASLDILNNGGLLVRNAGSTFGLGWLGALLVLSGSPIAASALTLVAGGSIDVIQGFTMLTGSRLGAAFVVLLVGVIYALRGGRGQRKKPVATAVLALCVTALIYVPGAIIGFLLLQWEPFSGIQGAFPMHVVDMIDVIYAAPVAAVEGLPGPAVFFLGLLILLASLKMIDSIVPEMSEEAIERTWAGRLRRKWPMFGLGCLVALVTMSVSVALTILVPLVAKNCVKRQDILPYIMGANIATLGDTLLAAYLLGSPDAVTIVLAGILGVTLVSLIVLTFFYEPVKGAIWSFQNYLVGKRNRLAVFTAALFVVPLGIIGASWFAG